MANTNPNCKTRWKKGQSGNPKGKTPQDPEIRRLKKLTAKELEDMISLLMKSTREELEVKKNDPLTPLIQKIVIQVLFKTHNTGNMGQLDLILNRVIGKVKDQVEVNDLRPTMLTRTDGTQVIFSQTPINKDEENE